MSDDLLRLGLSLIPGGLIGAERQWTGRSAGSRTRVTVAMGAAVLGRRESPQVWVFIGAGTIPAAGSEDRIEGIMTGSRTTAIVIPVTT